MKRITLVSLLILALPLAAGAQNAPAIPRSFSDCQSIEETRARYLCYDLVEALNEGADQSRPAEPASPATPARTIAPAPAAESREVVEQAPEPSREQDSTPPPQEALAGFGREVPNASRIVVEQGQEELQDRIVALREREPNKWLITLESGQVWYQTNSQRYRLREGMEVRIYPSRMGGAWRLSANELNGFIQVHRVD